MQIKMAMGMISLHMSCEQPPDTTPISGDCNDSPDDLDNDGIPDGQLINPDMIELYDLQALMKIAMAWSMTMICMLTQAVRVHTTLTTTVTTMVTRLELLQLQCLLATSQRTATAMTMIPSSILEPSKPVTALIMIVMGHRRRF